MEKRQIMANEKVILGRITCPSCGEQEAMRITTDKNGAPFGYCDMNCEVQLRLGGNQLRVKSFLLKHPHIKAAYEATKNPVTDTGEKVAAVEPVKVEAKKPVEPVKTKAVFSLGEL
jgi:hypothetical protein